ncbi:MAG: replicative DNA helicase [Pseudomonadota bacterium]
MAKAGSEFRVSPHNIEAEKSVLGAILLDNEAIYKVQDILKSEDFYKESHKHIFATIELLFDKQEPIDSITLIEELNSSDMLSKIGGAAYVADLVDFVPTSANIVYYASIIKEKSIRRNLISVATSIAEQGYSAEGEVEDFVDFAQQSVFKVSETEMRQTAFPLSDVLKRNFIDIEKRYEEKREITGKTSGYKDLDRLLHGFQSSELIILAARPSMGKTALALNFAVNSAINDKIPVLIFSLEMSKEQLSERLLCSQSRIDSNKIKSGFLDDTDWKKLANAAGVLSEAKIFIDDIGGLKISDLRARARRIKKEQDIGLIVVDYLQLINAAGRFGNKEQEVAEISKSLKNLAKELVLPVICLSQLNRAVEARTDKRPMMSDLRESGAIEQDADVIMFIYRDAFYNPQTEDPTKSEIRIAKHRNGAVGNINLRFFGEYTRFDNYSYEDEI